MISADQTEGAEIPVGTAVNLVVASGRVTIIDVTGYTVDAATRELEDLGLTVTTQEDTSCPATAPPTVASQSLAPGDVPIHSDDHAHLLLGPLSLGVSDAGAAPRRGPRHPRIRPSRASCRAAGDRPR